MVLASLLHHQSIFSGLFLARATEVEVVGKYTLIGQELLMQKLLVVRDYYSIEDSVESSWGGGYTLAPSAENP